jgi:hypothetical protein
MQVVVLVRHPASFTLSIKRRNAQHPFSHFLEQPLFMNGPLALHAERIAAFAALERDIGDQAGLLGRVLVDAVLGLRDRHPDWLFIKDLTRDPEAGFRTICGHVGVPFSREVQREIEDTTSTKNPTDATSARPRSHFLRDTAAIVDR